MTRRISSLAPLIGEVKRQIGYQLGEWSDDDLRQVRHYFGSGTNDSDRLSNYLTAELIANRALGGGLDVGDCHGWFTGEGLRLNLRIDEKLHRRLARVAPDQLRDLMPYVLEFRELGTLRQARKNPEIGVERTQRRKTGTFYTPSDVVQTTIGVIEPDNGGKYWLDPACGSGVFLRQIYRNLVARQHVSRADAVARIFGLDIDPWALDLAAFVLTVEDLVLFPRLPNKPVDRWRRFRRNLAEANTLAFSNEDLSLWPEVERLGGFDRIVGNPPFSKMAENATDLRVQKNLNSGLVRPSDDMSRHFVEICLTLLREHGALSLVMPLSLATSTRGGFPATRKLIAGETARIEIRNFDRSPDSLFGDDVKVRNTILVVDRSRPKDLMTTSLRRWSSERRQETLLGEAHTVSVENLSFDRAGSWPKVSFPEEVRILRDLEKMTRSDPKWWDRRRPTSQGLPGYWLEVSKTAYNAFSARPYDRLPDDEDYAPKGSVFAFNSEEALYSSYAVVCSGFVYWMWRVWGDGFHVTRGFLEQILTMVPPNRELGVLGESLWLETQQKVTTNVNKGIETQSYLPVAGSNILRSINDEVLSSLAIQTDFDFEQFRIAMIKAGRAIL